MRPACCLPVVQRFAARIILAFAAVVILLSITRSASAQQNTFYLDRLDIGSNPEDGFAVWRPRMHERTRFFGQTALGYSLHPLRGETVAPVEVRNASTTPNPVNHQLTPYLSAGVEIMRRVGIGVTVPFVLYQTGDDPCQYSYGACQYTNINSTVPSDIRLDGRVLFYNGDRWHLGMAGSLWTASGDRISFTTDDSGHGSLKALAELDLRTIIFSLNTGIHFRPVRGLNRLGISDEWTWALGGFIPLREGRVRVGAQLFGSTGIAQVNSMSTTFTKANTPLEWLGELRFALDQEKAGWFGLGAGTRLSAGYGAPDLRVVANIGYAFSIKDTDPNAPGRRYQFRREMERELTDTDKDGIPDDIDLCPTVPEDHQPPDVGDGCPVPPDRDHDGIPDDSDKCPDQPEDKDGIDDLDGCPEDDFDQDGIPDASDACPREPGQPSPDPKKNGCPQFIRHVEGSTEIQILKKVEFATGSATLLPKSFPILDEVVSLMKTNREISRVSIEGHTDSRGAHDMNMKLSQGRAESVMRYMSQHGIAQNRLEAHGYGPDRAIDTNDTDEGRQRNRRVEFHIKSSE